MTERGDIWLANLDPPSGTEPGKTRPVVVLQADALSRAAHPSTIIAPLTTRLIDEAAPLRIRVARTGDLTRDSDVLIDQIRAIDNRRLVTRLARVDDAMMSRVDSAIRDVLDL